MVQLTYSDRELLLRTLDSVTSESRISDTELLEQIFLWVKQLTPTFGFERALTRDATALSRYLVSHNADDDIAEIARGALLYALHDKRDFPSRLMGFALLDAAFICSYAIHEIRRRLGVPATYSPPQLTHSERERAEAIFSEFLGQQTLGDVELVSAVQVTVDSWGNLGRAGLFSRMRRDITFLTSVLNDHSRSDEPKDYARAALKYLICETDAIDDRLGLVGFIDDAFIARLAVELIEPLREPWLELLDATVASWPFLNSLLLDDGGGVCLPSEYMIVNSALSCTEIRAESGQDGALLIVPTTGPTPFLLGLVASIGLIQSSRQHEHFALEFYDGQKVIVDHYAIAEFAGFDECNGRKMFKLRQFRSEGGHRLERIRYWPISDLGRLAPAGASPVIRGALNYDLSHSDVAMTGLSYLFGNESATHFTAIQKRIVVVTSIAGAHDLATGCSLNGWALKDVLPMGHVNVDSQTVRRWSNRFGNQEPILIFVSDLDSATAFIEDDPQQYALVIVAATGRNAAKHASLQRLKRAVPTLIVADDQSADDIDTTGVAVWEWTNDDFRELVWPSEIINDSSGVLAKHERRLRTNASSTPVIETVSLRSAANAFEAHRLVRQLAKQRGEGELAEFEELLSIGFWIMSQLLRCATPFYEQLPSVIALDQQFIKFEEIRRSSKYLSHEEQKALTEFYCRMQDFVAELKIGNPKARRMQDLLAMHPNSAIICPDARLIPDLERQFADVASCITATGYSDSVFPNGIIIPGWFRKSRMRTLLSPPIASPLTILLYDVEKPWYYGFVNERKKARQNREGKSSRSMIFPQFDGWHSPESSQSSADGQIPNDIEDAEEHAFDIYKARIYRTNKTAGGDDSVPAHLVLFVGGAYGFFTDTYKLNVVTHLLEGIFEDDDEDVSVSLTPINKLQVGDAIVFRQSSRDIIREVADTILPVGTRELSASWRRAILNFVRENNFSAAQLCERLREAGCSVQRQAVEGWLRYAEIIAPLAYNRDVPAIAKATGDVELKQNLESVLEAIRQVRSAHLKASGILAKQVRRLAVEVLRQERSGATAAHLHDGFVIVRVAEVAPEKTHVRYASANQLIEDDSWLV